jgi:hypothetical protein
LVIADMMKRFKTAASKRFCQEIAASVKLWNLNFVEKVIESETEYLQIVETMKNSCIKDYHDENSFVIMK